MGFELRRVFEATWDYWNLFHPEHRIVERWRKLEKIEVTYSILIILS